MALPPILPNAGARFDPNEAIAWANESFLVMRKGAVLPDRCVKCNAPARGRTITRRFLWADTSDQPAGGPLIHIPYLRLIPLLASLFRWLSDLRTMQVPRVRVGVCRKHQMLCRFYTAIMWLGIPAGIVCAYEFRNDFVTIWSIVFGIAASGIAARIARPVAPVHVGIHHITLRGVGYDFLRSLDPARMRSDHRSPDNIADSIAAMKRKIQEEKKNAVIDRSQPTKD